MNKGNGHNHTGKVDSDMLFRYFGKTATQEEKTMIYEWLKESDEHKNIFRNNRRLYEAFLLHAPMEVLEGRPAKSAAVIENKRRASRLIMLNIGYAAIFAVCCIFGFHIINNNVEDRLAETMNTIVVPAGQRLDYTLADGTDIKLNSGAKLQYPMTFAEDCREVHLDGEAYFDVEHDAEKPFVVRTFASDIEVLGTEFNVNADEAAGTFSATLVEGSIRLSNSLLPGEHIIMHPNEKVTLVKDHMILEERNASRDICWTDGIIDIGGLDFQGLMKKLEKTFGVSIVIERDKMPELEYTGGKIRISDGIDNALKVIRHGAEFTYRRNYETGTIYIH